MNSKESSSSENYKTQAVQFIIPQNTYNKMLYDILWVKNVRRSDILELLSLQDSVKQAIFTICAENGYTEDDLLERSRVWMRTEKEIEDRSLLEFWKWYIKNASKLSDIEIIEIVKKDIENRSKNNKVRWQDGSINYIETQDAVIDTRIRKKEMKEQTEALKQNWINHRIKVLASLSLSDKNELDIEVQKALSLSKKISKWRWVEIYLKSWRCKDSKKLTSVAAQKYFHKEYSRLYTEKFPNIKNELYPPDREIVVIPLSNNWKYVCKVRGEKEIINIVVKKINNWRIKLLDFIIDENNQQMTERNRAKVEMILQNTINEYYKFLYLYEYKSVNKLWNTRYIPLDLETISTDFWKIIENNVHTLSLEEFSEKLKEQKIKSITEKAKRDKSIKAKEKELINNIPVFNWFDWVLDFYKVFIESALKENNPDLRQNRPSRVKILENYWFIYLKQWSVVKHNSDIIIKLQPTKKSL